VEFEKDKYAMKTDTIKTDTNNHGI